MRRLGQIGKFAANFGRAFRREPAATIGHGCLFLGLLAVVGAACLVWFVILKVRKIGPDGGATPPREVPEVETVKAL